MKPWPKGDAKVRAEDAELSSCLSPREAFSRRGLQRAKENGRSLLEVALYIAFQLGMEQGRRQAARDRVD